MTLDWVQLQPAQCEAPSYKYVAGIRANKLKFKDFRETISISYTSFFTRDGNCGTGVACGIIARSAGLGENTKKICACDGVSAMVIWW